jgi:hypothetical protein
MPIFYRIYADYNCVLKVWVGEVTMETWYAVERRIMEDPDLPRRYKLLIDVRKAGDINVSEQDVKGLADFYQDYSDQIKGVQVAILAGDEFDKARLYEKTVQPLGMNVIAFANFDTACLWLNLDRKLVSEWIEQLTE